MASGKDVLKPLLINTIRFCEIEHGFHVFIVVEHGVIGRNAPMKQTIGTLARLSAMLMASSGRAKQRRPDTVEAPARSL